MRKVTRRAWKKTRLIVMDNQGREHLNVSIENARLLALTEGREVFKIQFEKIALYLKFPTKE